MEAFLTDAGSDASKSNEIEKAGATGGGGAGGVMTGSLKSGSKDETLPSASTLINCGEATFPSCTSNDSAKCPELSVLMVRPPLVASI